MSVFTADGEWVPSPVRYGAFIGIIVAHVVLAWGLMKLAPVPQPLTDTPVVFAEFVKLEGAVEDPGGSSAFSATEMSSPAPRDIPQPAVKPIPQRQETPTMTPPKEVITSTKAVTPEATTGVTVPKTVDTVESEPIADASFSPVEDTSTVMDWGVGQSFGGSDVSGTSGSGQQGTGSTPGTGHGTGTGSGRGSGAGAIQVTESQIVYRRKVRPDYPKASERLREAGTVQILFKVDLFGKPVSTIIKKSSGFSRLDNAALAAAKKTLFEPYRVNGSPQPVEFTVPYEFIAK